MKISYIAVAAAVAFAIVFITIGCILEKRSMQEYEAVKIQPGTENLSQADSLKVVRIDTTRFREPEPEEIEESEEDYDYLMDTEDRTEEPEEEPYLTFEEESILMQLAMAEAEGETTEGKALVMRVVLNRVENSDFPDSVYGVVFQDGQFSPVNVGGRYYTVTPNEDCYEALDWIESGWDESEGALYFESCRSDSWQSRNLEFLFQCGNHRFYK